MTMHQVLPVLSVKGLVKSRAAGKAEAYSLRVPLLEARPGDKILLTGPSGSGKSTLLDMLGMVLRPDAVEEFLFRPGAGHDAGHGAGTGHDAGRNARLDTGRGAGHDADRGKGTVPGSGPNKEQDKKGGEGQTLDVALAWRAGDTEKLALWRRGVGYVLQTGGLLPFLSVRENIRCQRRLLALPPDAEDVDRLVEELKIGRLLSKLPAALSVGERQRVAIARALAANPALVLADEPTAALDPENAATVLAMFARAVNELGATLIMVSHAPEQVQAMNFRHFVVRTARREDGVLAVLQPLSATEGRS